MKNIEKGERRQVAARFEWPVFESLVALAERNRRSVSAEMIIAVEERLEREKAAVEPKTKKSAR